MPKTGGKPGATISRTAPIASTLKRTSPLRGRHSVLSSSCTIGAVAEADPPGGG